jgi:hypothetical protein
MTNIRAQKWYQVVNILAPFCLILMIEESRFFITIITSNSNLKGLSYEIDFENVHEN